jgi:uncharacterized Zn-binding protein involved in type VI secretion
MGAPIARKGDIFVGTCSSCDGATVTGVLIGDAKTVQCQGRSVALMGGLGIGRCGHSTTIISGSSTVRAEGRSVAHVGTPVASSIKGKIISGSNNVTVGG